MAAGDRRERRATLRQDSIIDRSDGTSQWAYNGMPLYLYHDDAAPGDAEGDGKGGVWHIVH
jgi:predicted lipoprotein with Yx(FWY)xxD motif